MRKKTAITYIVDTYLLMTAARFLQPVEKVFFLTGIRLMPDLVVLTEIVPVRFTSSRVGAEPDPVDVFRKQQELKKAGMSIEAQFHSHPGREPWATKPSGTDDNTGRRWENGAPFLGAIFSEGGKYVRFWNHAQKSIVHVYGSAQEIEPNVFELPLLGGEREPAPCLPPMPAEDGEPERPVEPDGQAVPDQMVPAGKRFALTNLGRRLRRAWKQRASGPCSYGVRLNRLL